LTNLKTKTIEKTFDAKENCRTKIYFVIIDRLKTQLNTRCEAYLSILETFGCIPTLYKDHSVHDIKQTRYNLVQKFPNDIESSKILEAECLHLRELILTQTNLLKNCDISPACFMLKCFEYETLEVFPHLEIVMSMYLCTTVANCTGERSFSVLKRVKNYLRLTMTNERLNTLTLLNIEADLLKSLNMD